jgi:hypothetical protein
VESWGQQQQGGRTRVKAQHGILFLIRCYDIPSEKVMPEPTVNEVRESQLTVWWKRVPDKGNAECKVPLILECSQKRKERYKVEM